jgi:hypothetical protein
MASDKQLTANRANSKKSTGPRTPEGKRRSSLNNLGFGLYSHDIREHLTDDERVRFDEFIDRNIKARTPFDEDERFLAERIAYAMFMLERADQIGIGAICKSDAQVLQSTAIFSNRRRADYERYSALLEKRQSARKAKEAEDLQKALVVTQAAALTRVSVEPRELGFDFSKLEVLLEYLRRKVNFNAHQVLQDQDMGTRSEDNDFAFTERLKSYLDIRAQA